MSSSNERTVGADGLQDAGGDPVLGCGDEQTNASGNSTRASLSSTSRSSRIMAAELCRASTGSATDSGQALLQQDGTLAVAPGAAAAVRSALARPLHRAMAAAQKRAAPKKHVLITVDSNHHENALAAAIEGVLGPAHSVNRRSLAVGDVLVHVEGEPDAGALLFEIKRSEDWAASIRSGRLNDQRSRLVEHMQACGGAVKATLVYQGAWPGFCGIRDHRTGISPAAVSGSILRSWTRDHIGTMCVPTQSDVAELVAQSAVDLAAGKLAPKEAGGQWQQARAKRPRDQRCMRAPVELMLAVLDGVGDTTAAAVAAAYPSVAALVAADQSDIAAVSIGVRRVGPAAAAIIKSTFHA